jgi:hypothetical protein
VIDPNVVGIVFENDIADRFKLRPAERQQYAITAIRHVQRLGFRDVCDALRLIEPREPADDLPPSMSTTPTVLFPNSATNSRRRVTSIVK